MVENAVKYTPAGGRVDVRLETSATDCRITVEDSGPGIAPDALPYVFDRFYRAGPERTRLGGAGLGLSIARTIAHAHGGKLEAHSRNGSGAAFVLTLPLLGAAPSGHRAEGPVERQQVPT
ncbi:MAG: ATP-binding protein [Bryobacterales bacterium]